MLITPEEIKTKAVKKFKSFLISQITGEPFFPLIIAFAKIKARDTLKNFAHVGRSINLLKKHSKEAKGKGYTVEFKQRADRKIGVQNFPEKISFTDKEDYLACTGKKREYRLFRDNLERTRNTIPELTEWAQKHPQKLILEKTEWEDILKVCTYFIKIPRPGLYLRELPIPVHTKFIEEHKGLIASLLDFLIQDHINPEETQFEKRYSLKYPEKQIRFKILDRGLAKTYFSGLTDISIPVSDFNTLDIACSRVIIMENKTSFSNILNFLTLPDLTGTIALFGSGFGAGLLKEARWLQTKKLYYWGDIDVHGFSILSAIRSFLPSIQSIMMDKTTFTAFTAFTVTGPQGENLDFTNLNTAEQQLVSQLAKLTENNRLEQEKIPHDYAIQEFKKVFT